MNNYFNCPDCNQMTEHVTITEREVSAHTGASVTEQVLVSIDSARPVNRIIKRLVGRYFWKCSHCGKITYRNSAGDILNSID